MQDRPLAVAGLLSFRYPSRYGGYVMIGARDYTDALREAQRSVAEPVNGALLETWDGLSYVRC